MKNYIGYVYLTINLINNKKYIGKHVGKIEDNYLGSGKYFKNALNKYGADNFEKRVLEICHSRSELDAREIYWIDFYDAVAREDFYNLAIGGQGGGMFGEDNGMYGKTHTIETRRRLSETHKGCANPKSKRVLCDGEVFESIGLFCETKGLNRSTINRQLQTKRLSKELYDLKTMLEGDNFEDYSYFTEETLREEASIRSSGENNPMYGREYTEEEIENIRARMIGENNPMFGKKHSDETKNKIRQNRKPITVKYYAYHDKEHTNIFKEFSSLKDALEFLGIKGHSKLMESIKLNEEYKGYYWVK